MDYLKQRSIDSALDYLSSPGPARDYLRVINDWKMDPHPSINQSRFDPGKLPNILYQKWLEIGSPEELEGFYVDNSTMFKLEQYDKHSKLLNETP